MGPADRTVHYLPTPGAGGCCGTGQGRRLDPVPTAGSGVVGMHSLGAKGTGGDSGSSPGEEGWPPQVLPWGRKIKCADFQNI